LNFAVIGHFTPPQFVPRDAIPNFRNRSVTTSAKTSATLAKG